MKALLIGFCLTLAGCLGHPTYTLEDQDVNVSVGDTFQVVAGDIKDEDGEDLRPDWRLVSSYTDETLLEWVNTGHQNETPGDDYTLIFKALAPGETAISVRSEFNSRGLERLDQHTWHVHIK